MLTSKIISPFKQLAPYNDKRILGVFVLGVAQGLPWVMIGSMLTLWLKESGIGRAEIGYAALIFTVYAINFLWSPLVDSVTPKFLGKLGKRQSWVFFCQIIVALSCCAMSFFEPAFNAKTIVLIALVIAVFSATQDIAIDAYRVDSFAPHETERISAAAGMITAGWWTGYAGLGYLPLRLSDMGWTWPQLYLLLATITLILSTITALLPKPLHTRHSEQKAAFSTYLLHAQHSSKLRKVMFSSSLIGTIFIIVWAVIGSPGMLNGVANHSAYIPSLIFLMIIMCICIGFQLGQLQKAKHRDEQPLAENTAQHGAQPGQKLDSILAWMLTAFIAPLREFFSRNGVKFAISLLSFILLFKLGEAFLGRMSIVFYKEVGFSNTEIGTYSKLLTWWLTIIFALAGGLVNAKLGLVKGLFISGIAMACTNLIFALIAIIGPEVKLYAVAVVLDGFAAAWSTVAFVSFISLMCNHAFSATQYALMASLSNLGRTTLSSVSGQIVDWMNGNWSLFFVMTTVMVIPSLVILWRMRAEVFRIENATSRD
jgi:PAT family beta-lactamase induction signal transducer AmpG